MLAIAGYYWLFDLLTHFKYKFGIAAIAALFIIYPALKLFPYYFTYFNPLFVDATVANALVGQKAFGVGVFDLKEFLVTNYGDYPAVGLIDTKPLGAIYKNSRIFDIRIAGTSNYDLIVLAVNENFPDKSQKQNDLFVKEAAIKINGLDYWNIYAKKVIK